MLLYIVMNEDILIEKDNEGDYCFDEIKIGKVILTYDRNRNF